MENHGVFGTLVSGGARGLLDLLVALCVGETFQVSEFLLSVQGVHARIRSAFVARGWL
jgi:hypothetical protein